ncbi:hypothetical protein V6Z12_D02G012800 [Gossypium hirsutum]
MAAAVETSPVLEILVFPTGSELSFVQVRP